MPAQVKVVFDDESADCPFVARAIGAGICELPGVTARLLTLSDAARAEPPAAPDIEGGRILATANAPAARGWALSDDAMVMVVETADGVWTECARTFLECHSGLGHKRLRVTRMREATFVTGMAVPAKLARPASVSKINVQTMAYRIFGHGSWSRERLLVTVEVSRNAAPGAQGDAALPTWDADAEMERMRGEGRTLAVLVCRMVQAQAVPDSWTEGLVIADNAVDNRTPAVG